MSNEQKPARVPKKKVVLQSIHITDYKGIAELDEEIDGKHFIVFGKNGEGKTSALEVIDRAALRIDPKDMADVPIKVGAKNSTTKVIWLIEEEGKRERRICVHTTFRPSGNVMKLIDLENDGELKPAIERLTQILGNSVDVTPLMTMTGEQQFAYILKMFGGGESFEVFKAQRKEQYDLRSLENKAIKAAQLEIEKIRPSAEHLKEYDAGKYVLGISETEYPEKPNKESIELARKLIEADNAEITRAQNGVNALKEEKAELERKLEAINKRIEDGNTWLEANPLKTAELVEIGLKEANFDTTMQEYEDKMKAIREHDAIVKAISDFKAQKEAQDARLDKVIGYNAEMAKIDQQMKDALTKINVNEMVPELELLNEVITDEETGKTTEKVGLFYKDGELLLPFNDRQISYAKCILAMAKLSSFINYGKLNLIHIAQWESLDDDSRNEILDFAKENADLNMQFGIEQVENTHLGIKLIEFKGENVEDDAENEENE